MLTKTQSIIADTLTKLAMHGSADYQMTEPITPPVPQDSLPDEEEGLKFPTSALAGGGLLGAGLGMGWQQQPIMSSLERLRFLKGTAEAGAPSVNATLLHAVQHGYPPTELEALKKELTTPAGVKSYFEHGYGPEAEKILAESIAENKKNILLSMAKGPGAGLLAGGLAGIGAGLLGQKLFKESGYREPGLLSKFAFRAPPPDPEAQRVPSEWHKYERKTKPNVFVSSTARFPGEQRYRGREAHELTHAGEAPHPAPQGVTAKIKRPPTKGKGLLAGVTAVTNLVRQGLKG